MMRVLEYTGVIGVIGLVLGISTKWVLWETVPALAHL